MKLLQVKEYNRQDMNKWHERVEEWKKSTTNDIIPQVAFVGFRLSNGELRQRGWVVYNKNQAYFRLNKQEAINKLSNQ